MQPVAQALCELTEARVCSMNGDSGTVMVAVEQHHAILSLNPSTAALRAQKAGVGFLGKQVVRLSAPLRTYKVARAASPGPARGVFLLTAIPRSTLLPVGESDSETRSRDLRIGRCSHAQVTLLLSVSPQS